MLKVRTNQNNKKEIWCSVRRKWVALTPEENVRQWFVNVLVDSGIEWGRIAVEQALNIDQRQFRADIIVYDKVGQPEILCECKAPNVEITDAVFAQANNYNSVLGVKELIVTNGKITLKKRL